MTKLVLREEGSFLHAYADSKTGNGKTELLVASISIGIVNRNHKAKKKFIKLIKKHVGHIMGDVELPVEEVSWHPQQRAKL